VCISAHVWFEAVYCLQHLENSVFKVFFKGVGYTFVYEYGFIFWRVEGTGKLLHHFIVC
jgi:hypothetical protein